MTGMPVSAFIKPCLLSRTDRPRSGPGWIFPELREVADSGLIDPLRNFSEACRAESQSLHYNRPTRWRSLESARESFDAIASAHQSAIFRLAPKPLQHSPQTVKVTRSALEVLRSIVIAGHKTSISLEDEFWHSFKEIAGERGMTVAAMIGTIDGGRKHANLSSAIRLFVLGAYRDQIASWGRR